MPSLTADLLVDVALALALFVLIIATIHLLKGRSTPWVNRKLIHLSASPAALSYIYLFKEPYVFSAFSVLLAILLLTCHLRRRESSWFQLRGNYGEVYFCLVYAVLSVSMWNLNRVLAGVVMLFMAVGDAVTGLVRARFIRKRGKHWTGSLAMFAVCSALSYVFFGWKGLILSLVATLAELQPLLDDNIAIPLATVTTGLLII